MERAGTRSTASRTDFVTGENGERHRFADSVNRRDQSRQEVAERRVPVALGVDDGWVLDRWVRILDRIEHRQPGVGLRFWGPPLWLEVTMTGPDSDLWPTVSDEITSWDWQSATECEVARLADAGLDDDGLLAVVARYTIENLILNAVHEIGEWFRFDGERVFPAHPSTAAVSSDDDDQGNGKVTVRLAFGESRDPLGAGREERHGSPMGRLPDEVAASRFTYLPGTQISYEPAGPVIVTPSDTGSSPWRAGWSSATRAAMSAAAPELLAAVARDVHGGLVAYEADRICRAFHVDGTRPWRLIAPEPGGGADRPDREDSDAAPLSLSLDYGDTPGAVALLRR
jgi:hypothetical protein